MLKDIKIALRINHTALDSEVLDLIEEARHDLMLSGISSIKANDDSDPLIKRAIKTYAKANFGWDNPDSEKLKISYESLKNHLASSGDYNAVS
ncbi:DNA-packaging protein [Robertmurraya korlensis]|uniref:phage head-tail connector protein n=1 Tax=Robertmurraya korlensis TaxID=519977 RepID=UPI002040225C|nr:DNA-packaging protein [Robertmurraya korlensis]MCM3600634.1 DNA-packaging protein [Robertmurraya korlensis]